jgi:drug/metabolite transporter (DMT)-like permease
MNVGQGVRPAAAAGLLPWAVGMVTILIWGATPAATKFAVAEIDAFVVGMLRTVIAGLAVVPAVLLLRLPLPAHRADWRLLAISSASGFIGFPLLFSLALAHTSTAHAALVLAFAPILTGLVGAAVERRRPSHLWWGGVAIALAGEAALILLRGQDTIEATLYGDLLALASCFAVAGGYVAGSRLSPSIGTWSVTAWGAVLASLLLLPILAIRFVGGGLPDAGALAWGATLSLAMFSSLLAYVAWYWALAAGGVARISTLQFLQPVVTLLLAVVIFSEAMEPALLLSAGAILVGVTMARRG